MPLFVFFSFATSFMVSIMFSEKPFVSFCPHPHTRPYVYKEKTHLRHSEQSWVQKTVASSPTLPPCFSTCLQKCWVAGGLGCSDGSHIAKSHRREEEEGEENLHEKLWIPFSRSSTGFWLYSLEQKRGIFFSWFVFSLPVLVGLI